MRIRDLWAGVTIGQAVKEVATATLVVVGVWAYIWLLYFTGILG